MDDPRVSKVEILIQQERFVEAEKILSEILTRDSNNVSFLALLSDLKLRQDKHDEANHIIDNAIGLAPDFPYLFYIKSRIALHQDYLNEAERNINHAIKLDPNDSDYFASLANIKLARKEYQNALEMSNKALEIDAENLLALNTRSTALIKLNRSDESFETIEGALREDPNNEYTHTNYGWNLLEKGEHVKALDHFKEALSIDPNFDYAQQGMLEAIKATNPIYRIFLKYSFFMSNLTEKYQWGVIIGFYVGFRILRTLSKNNETLQPYLTPLILLIAILAFSTWIITPISNLFLRFNKYGQLLLDKKEKLSSSLVAVSLGVFLIGILLYVILSDERMLSIAVFGFAMMIPLGIMFTPTKNKNGLLIYTIALFIVGLIAIAMVFSTGEYFNPMAILFIIGFVAFQWVANFIIIREDN